MVAFLSSYHYYLISRTAKDMMSAMTYSLSFDDLNDNGFDEQQPGGGGVGGGSGGGGGSTTGPLSPPGTGAATCGGDGNASMTSGAGVSDSSNSADLFEKMCSDKFMHQAQDLDTMWSEKEKEITFSSAAQQKRSVHLCVSYY